MFGMPIFILKALAGIAALFIIYSGACFIIKPVSWSTYLRIIMLANILYGLYTLAMVAYYFADLTRLGVIYFLLENVVIVGVVWLENQVIASQKL